MRKNHNIKIHAYVYSAMYKAQLFKLVYLEGNKHPSEASYKCMDWHSWQA